MCTRVCVTPTATATVILDVSPSLAPSLSSIVNVPGEWTLRREFLRLQTEDRDGSREGGHAGGHAGAATQQVGLSLTSSIWSHVNMNVE